MIGLRLSSREGADVPGWLSRILPSSVRDAVEFLLQPAHLTGACVVSALLFVVSLVALPWLVVRIPVDHFSAEPSRSSRWPGRFKAHPVWFVLRNLLGVVLLASGIAMVFLPGQGLLTIFAAIFCLDFPGKRALERYIVALPPVIRALNAIRRRAGREPLDVTPKQ